jgi:hypothetical protein
MGGIELKRVSLPVPIGRPTLFTNKGKINFYESTAKPTAFGPYCGNCVLLFSITLVVASKLTVYPQGSSGAVFNVQAVLASPISPNAL